MKWNFSGQVEPIIVTENDSRNWLNQPTDLLIDEKTGCLIICDHGHRRVVYWCRYNGPARGEIFIGNITCWGLALDIDENLYVSDTGKHEVRRYRIGDTNGTLLAGGHGQGTDSNQLNQPAYLFVDRKLTVYVSDKGNNRVMKWDENATIGIIVAGSRGTGGNLASLFSPQGLFIDPMENLYVADSFNDRVVRWSKGAKESTVVIGGKERGSSSNQFQFPMGLSIDGHGNLYVADQKNHRIQRFTLE